MPFSSGIRLFFPLVLLAVTLARALPARARTLTWNQAVELARQNSLEYQSALSNYTSVMELEKTGLSGFLPQVSASASATQSRAVGGNPSVGGSQSYSAQLSVSQNLFSGLADINTYYLRKTNTEQALAVLNAAKARLSSELKQAYAEVYYLQDYRRLTADILKRRQENYNHVRLQYEIGRENKGSLLLSESYVEMARYDQTSTENSEEIAHENLRRVLGLPAAESLEVTDNIAREDLGPERPDFAAIADRHPDVLTARSAEMSALYNRNVTRAGFLPSLDLSGRYGYSGDRFFPDQDSWSVGLTLSIPLFDGLRTYANYHSSSAVLESNRFSTRNILLKVTADVKAAYFEYVQALQKEKIDQGFNRAAIMRAEVARNKYKNGFITFEEWDIVETDLISRQKENLSSERNRIIKQSAWEQAQGIGVF